MKRRFFSLALLPFLGLQANATPNTPSYKEGFTLHEETDSKMTLGGRVKVDGYYDIDGHQPGSTYGLDAARIPLRGTNDNNSYKRGNFNYSLMASRLNADVRKIFCSREFKGFIEIDFAGNVSSTSNSYEPRIRHAYFEGCGWLIGQTWFTFADPDAFIDTFDNVFATGRQATIRYTHKFCNWQFVIGLDRPDTQIYQFAVNSDTGTTDSAYTGFFDNGSNRGTAKSQYPDLAMKVRYDYKRGYFALRGVIRDLQIASKSGDNNAVTSYKKSRMGWGAGVSSKLIFCDYFSFLFQGNMGEGIGKYIDDLNNGNGFDSVFIYPTTLNAQQVQGYQNHYKLAKAWNLIGGFAWDLTEKLSSNFTASYTRVSKPKGLGDLYGKDFNRILQRYIWNMGYKILPNSTLGLEVLHYRRKSGVPHCYHGKDTRVLTSFIYKF